MSSLAGFGLSCVVVFKISKGKPCSTIKYTITILEFLCGSNEIPFKNFSTRFLKWPHSSYPFRRLTALYHFVVLIGSSLFRPIFFF